MAKSKAKADKGFEKELSRIGAKLKALRIKKGFSSAEIFAYEHDINRVQYWRMERGANFTMQSLLRVLRIHKISFEEFSKGL